MVESKTVNSSNNGNWVSDSPLTKALSKSKNFDNLKNIIERYSRTNLYISSTENKEVCKDLDEPRIEFVLPPVNDFYDIYNSKRFSKKIQNWKGIVLEITDNSFIAKLFDLTNGGTYEIGEFELNEVSPNDQPLLFLGSIFYWSVGHYMENGQIVKRSDIRFQRLITLDMDDIDNVQSEIEYKYSNLKEKKLEEYTP